MWKNLLTKLKIERANKKTMRELRANLCNPKKPFTAAHLHTLYVYLKKQDAPLLISPEVNDRYVEVSFEENKIDWFSFRIKYSVPNMDITMKIAVRAGAPQIGSDESDRIFLTIESIIDNDRRKSYRQIIERNFEFINAIDYKNLDSDIKTPKMENNVYTVKKILANSFEIIIDHLIKWV